VEEHFILSLPSFLSPIHPIEDFPLNLYYLPTKEESPFFSFLLQFAGISSLPFYSISLGPIVAGKRNIL